jgi:hypothetical protein
MRRSSGRLPPVPGSRAGRHAGACLVGLLAIVAAAPVPADSMRAASAPGQTVAPDPLAGVRALIGDAACTNDEQCRTIGVGAKACGGPEAYLAWSTARTDARALEAAVAAYGGTRLDAVARGGRVSNCALTVDPGAWCRPSGQAMACQLRRAGQKPAQ